MGTLWASVVSLTTEEWTACEKEGEGEEEVRRRKERLLREKLNAAF